MAQITVAITDGDRPTVVTTGGIDLESGKLFALGGDCDAVDVHIEGALDASEDGWADRAAEVRPAGVSVHFTLDIQLAGTGERELAHRFDDGARTAAAAIEGMRLVFERLSGGER